MFGTIPAVLGGTAGQPSWNPGFEDFTSPSADDEWTFLSEVVSHRYDNENGGANYLLDSSGSGFNVDVTNIKDGNGVATPRNVWQSSVLGSTNRTPGYCLSQLSATPGNSNNEDLCIRIVFTSLQTFQSRNMLRKLDLTAGWKITTNVNGTLTVTLDDNVAAPITLTTSNDLSSGLQYFTFWYDYSANMLYAKDQLSSYSVSTAAMTGSITNGVKMHLNANSFSRIDGVNAVQYAYLGSATTNAATMYADDFWGHVP